MTDVLKLIDKLGLRYKEKGQDYLIQCTNPEHEDLHPSMRVDKLTGVYHCFSCGHKGNLLLDYGVRVDKIVTKVSKLLEKIVEIRKKGLDIPLGATKVHSDFRGIGADTLRYFEAFFHPDFEDRIVFPIRNINGEIEVFIARHLHTNTASKYIFSPKNISPPVFPSKPVSIENSSIILVEGIFDALNLIDKGLQNTICAFGTHTLLRSHREKLEYLKVMGIEKIYIMFDGDKAGKEAAEELEEVINKEIVTRKGYKIEPLFQAEIIELPDGVDPGALTQEDVNTIKYELYR
jgi:DNA primase